MKSYNDINRIRIDLLIKHREAIENVIVFGISEGHTVYHRGYPNTRQTLLLDGRLEIIVGRRSKGFVKDDNGIMVEKIANIISVRDTKHDEFLCRASLYGTGNIENLTMDDREQFFVIPGIWIKLVNDELDKVIARNRSDTEKENEARTKQMFSQLSVNSDLADPIEI